MKNWPALKNRVGAKFPLHIVEEPTGYDSLFRSFMNQSSNLSWLLDENAALLFANESFCKYFGLKAETAFNNNVFNLLPPEVTDSLYSKHVQVLETGRPVEAIEKVRWADGTNLIFHVNLFRVSDDAGRNFIGGHAVNVGEKYAVEKKLREVNERLMLITRATSDAIWEWDMQTGYIFRNDVLMGMIGYQAEESKGLSWWLRRIHPEDRNRVTERIKEATDKGLQSWSEAYRFKCADGEYKQVQDRGYVVYDNGLPVRMIGSLQDTTELYNLKDQLTEEKLQRQREISEIAIHVQERERTRIGHELHDNVNQILSTTRMFVEMLTPANEQEKMVKEKSIEYIHASIEEIRKLSKELAAPELKMNGLEESITSLIDDIHLSSALNIRFENNHDGFLLSQAKRVTIFRVVQEQLKNILKYSKATEVVISLSNTAGTIELLIKDNGVGFDPSQTRRGIGLSNIHDRVRFYNGTVNIDAAPGKGCTLTASFHMLD